MSEIITVIANLSAFTFTITSMLAMGLSLTIKQIVDKKAAKALQAVPVKKS